MLLTDGEGRFSSARALSGHLTVTIEAPGYQPLELPFELRAGQPNELELTLEPFLVVTGRVVDGSQRPVEGAEVRMSAVVFSDSRTVSAADGTFRFERGTDSTYFLVASKGLQRSQTLSVGASLNQVSRGCS